MRSVFPFPFPFLCVFGIDVEGFGMLLPLIYIDNCLTKWLECWTYGINEFKLTTNRWRNSNLNSNKYNYWSNLFASNIKLS